MMLQQPRGGHIFNIDGAGSDGRPTPRLRATSCRISGRSQQVDHGSQLIFGSSLD